MGKKRKRTRKDLADAAARLGRRGGPARMASMTPEERTRLARKGARARWKRKR